MESLASVLRLVFLIMRKKLLVLSTLAATSLSTQASEAAIGAGSLIMGIVESVPDGGATLALLGAGLAAVALLRRKAR